MPPPQWDAPSSVGHPRTTPRKEVAGGHTAHLRPFPPHINHGDTTYLLCYHMYSKLLGALLHSVATLTSIGQMGNGIIFCMSHSESCDY